MNTDDISEELYALLKIRNQIELKISILNEQIEFSNSIQEDLSPFINSFLTEFNVYFNKNATDKELLIHKMMIDVIQQIKSVCKHHYEEDDIDTNNCCENVEKITYCSICYSTFSK